MFWLFTLLSVAYIVLSLVIPPDNSALLKYDLSTAEAQLLKLTVTLPVVAIWFVAYYGYYKFSRYVSLLPQSAEKAPFRKLQRGLLILVLWLPVTSVISSLFSLFYTQNQDLTPSLIILTNYINIAILLYAFYYLAKGSRELAATAKKAGSWAWKSVAMIVMVIAGLVFVIITLADPYRRNPVDEGLTTAYFLPDWLLASTVIFPYLLIFYLGYQAATCIHTYKEQVNGVIYRSALKHIANGIGVVIISILAIRYFMALGTALNDANLRGILTTLYGLVIIIAIGFLLIARGAKKLQKIEEI